MNIHFIAIGGSAMHNLAIALHLKGYSVSGSDDNIFEPSKSRLKKYGLLPKEFGWFPSKIKSDLDEKHRFNETIRAMEKGYDLIYHAYLVDGDLRGEADFLIKCDTPSDLGDYSYEVYDTKITRNLRPRHVTQITAYSDMLGKIQKLLPKKDQMQFYLLWVGKLLLIQR